MILGNENKYAKELQMALQGDDKAAQEMAWNNFSNAIVEEIKADAELYARTNDKNVLAQRGYRQLTSAEERFYDKFIEASKDSADGIINIGTDSQTLFGAMTFTNNLIPYLAIKDQSLVLKNPTNGLQLERITSGDDGLIDGFQQNIGFGNTYRPFKPLLNTE